MAEPKYHWAVHSTPELANHCNAWTGHTGGRWIQACRSRKARYLEDSAAEFCAKSQDDPDWFCIPCAKAARLALAKESSPKPTPRPARSCSNCRSGAINPGHHGRTEADLDLCDVCYWRKRAPEPRPIGDAPHDGSLVLICLPDSKPQWTMGVFDRAHWIDLCCAASVVEPTHFLPLPPSPEVK